MKHISTFLKKYTNKTICKISKLGDTDWQVCSLSVGLVEVKGYGTTNTNALNDAFRLLKIKL